MTLPSTLRLGSLTLKNYRCFGTCDVSFHPSLTVLVAENGRGKTAILDAVGLALHVFVDTIEGKHQAHGFERSDIHLVRVPDGSMQPALPTELLAHGHVDGQHVRWARAVRTTSEKTRIRTTTKEAEPLKDAAQALRDRLDEYVAGRRTEPPPLPLVAFYGTGRLWSEHRLTEAKRTAAPSPLGRLSGYVDCLSSSSSFKAFVDWYETMAGAARDPASVALPAEQQPMKLIAAVREAAKTVLGPTRWESVDWDFERKQLVVEHPEHGRLPLSVLSDGVRNMVALVADVAHRCVRLNPHFGEAAAHMTPGVLLIDEVDMHLHPRWQQLVVELLQKAFPAMQMIVTTHSPHVLSTVDVDSIRVIRVRDGQGTLETPTFQTRGVESADVLAAIMGVDPVPQVEEARWLSQYRGMIEDGAAEEPAAKALRAKLIDHFGVQHPLMLDCERLLRFQAFKVKRANGRPGGG